MKKWLVILLMSSFVAGISAAEDNDPSGHAKEGGEHDKVEQQRPRRPQGGFRQSERGAMQRDGKREQMKAQFEAIKQQAEAIRAETDPAKKEELTAALRVKLAEGAERRQAEFRKRVEKAEADIAKMRERLESIEQNKETHIDEMLQRILSGEKPPRKGPGEQPGRQIEEGAKPGRRGPPAK